jgi:hypothetical protein
MKKVAVIALITFVAVLALLPATSSAALVAPPRDVFQDPGYTGGWCYVEGNGTICLIRMCDSMWENSVVVNACGRFICSQGTWYRIGDG